MDPAASSPASTGGALDVPPPHRRLLRARALAAHVPRPPIWGLALVLYLACELALFGPGILGRLQTGAVGSSPSSDYQVMTWSLEWWPWAVLHGHDPFYTNAVWAPWGYATAWMTSIPALALLAAPITLTAGPLAAYNVLMLAALPAAALAAYALCRELTHRFIPALIGGYIYGFSPYLLGQTIAQHLNLVQIWPFPLIALLAIRYLRGTCRPRWLVAGTATVGAIVLGSSLELVALAVPVAAVALIVAYATAAAPRRSILRLTAWLALAGTFVGLLALPFAWFTLVQRRPPLPYAPERYATDVANLVVPTTTVLGGTLEATLRLSARFVGNVGEQGGYLGVPLLLVCLTAIVSDRRRGVWVAGAAFVASLVWSMGPYIVIAGRTVASEPLSLDRLPVLDLSLPSRMASLTALGAAVLAAVWLARPGARWLRLAAGAVLVLSLWPQSGHLFLPPSVVALRAEQGVPLFAWQTAVVPRAPAAVSRPLHPDQSLLVLPFASRTPTAYWQAESGMRFRTVGGFTPFLPLQAVGDPTISSLFAGYPGPLAIERLRLFLRRAHVGRVAILRGAGRAWRRTIHDALRRPGGASPPLPASISAVGADAQAPNGTARAGRAAVVWSQWDPRCPCGRIAFSFPAGHASTPFVSSRGFEAYNPVIAVSRHGRFAASAWIEARAGNVRVGLVRAGTRVERLQLRDVGQPLEISVGIDDKGRVTLAETVQRGARALLVVQRLDARGVASAPAALSDPSADVLSPRVVEGLHETFAVWRQFDATATSIHVMTARAGRAWNKGVVLTRDSGGLGTPTLGVGPQGITLAWVASHGIGETPRAISLDRRGGALGGPVALGSSLPRKDVTRIAVAGDGETVVVTHGRTNGPQQARVVRVEPGESTLLRFAPPVGWRTAGPPAPVIGASLLAIPLNGPRGRRTLLEPLDSAQRLRMIPTTLNGRVIATRSGMAALHVGGSREAHQILLQPSRSMTVGGFLSRSTFVWRSAETLPESSATLAERVASPRLHEGGDIWSSAEPVNGEEARTPGRRWHGTAKTRRNPAPASPGSRSARASPRRSGATSSRLAACLCRGGRAIAHSRRGRRRDGRARAINSRTAAEEARLRSRSEGGARCGRGS